MGWWLLSTLAEIAIYPLFFRLAGALPSRGYALARTAGLMLIGFIFWLLGVLGLLRNTPGGTVLVAVILAIIGVIAYFTWRDSATGDPEDEGVRIIPWLRENVPLIVTTELLFVLLFFGWALVRALHPSLAGTEHPMDMAFLTASRRSATFPPNDPWLSNYAISYYHFGYIIMAMVANMSGVSNGIAYNLAIALLFALTGIGVFGVASISAWGYGCDCKESRERHCATTAYPHRDICRAIRAVHGQPGTVAGRNSVSDRNRLRAVYELGRSQVSPGAG